MSSTGIFTPTGAGTATITATSTQDATKSGSATVTVTAASSISSVTASCSPASILTSQTSTCTATVTGIGAFSNAVTWSATDGSITTSGVFTPTASGTATIKATSTQDGTKYGNTSVTVSTPTVPTVSQFSPAYLWTDSPDSTVTVTGTDFLNGVSVTLNGKPIGVNYVSANQINVVIPASAMKTLGWLVLTVANPGGAAYTTQTAFEIVGVQPYPSTATWPPNTIQNLLSEVSDPQYSESINYTLEESNSGTIIPTGFDNYNGVTSGSYYTPNAEGTYHILAATNSSASHNATMAITISDHAGRFEWNTQPAAFGSGHTLTLLPNGKVLIVGGFYCVDVPLCTQSSIRDTIELYDPSTRIFSLIGHLTAPRQFHDATLLTNETVLITGGYVSDQTKPLASAEIIDPSTGVSTAVGSFNTLRVGYTISALPNGKALVAGGQSSATILNTTELFDSHAQAFSAGPNMNFQRSYHTATVLPSGKVLVAGGNGNEIEVYDPQVNAFSMAGRLADRRSAQTAILLNDGRILFALGWNGYYGSGGDMVFTSIVREGFSEYFDTTKVVIPTDANTQTTTLGPQIQLLDDSMNAWYNLPALLNNGNVLYLDGIGAQLYSPATNSFTGTAAIGLYSGAFPYYVALPDGTAVVIDGSNPRSALIYYPDSSVLPNNPIPTLTSVFPIEAPVNSFGNIYVNGSGFAQGAFITLDGMFQKTSSISATELIEHPNNSLTEGTHLVAVTNPSPGGGTSNALQIIADAYVTVSPAGAGLHPAGTMQFSATVVGSTNQTVAWTAVEGSAGGSVTSSGLYTAPSVTGIYHVTATSPLHSNPAATVSIVVANSSYFSESGALNTRRVGHTASLLSSGKVLILGGTLSAADAQAETYDPATGTFTVLPSPITNPKILQQLDPRAFGTATTLQDGRVLISGGDKEASSTWPSIIYDPAANTFSETGPLNTDRIDETATLLQDGKVLVTGGTSGGGPLASTELYDPATGKFSTSGSMAATRSGHTATLLPSGKVLITGGNSLVSSNTISVVASAEIYDPTSGTFSSVSPMNYIRTGHTASLLSDGKVLIAGDGSLELFDPATLKFTAIGAATDVQPQFGTATLLTSGKVLVAGGGQSELVDSATLAVSPTNPPIEQRDNATATRLLDGTVLIVGGNLPQGEWLQTSEIYHP
jgi:phosphoheptose isomerase